MKIYHNYNSVILNYKLERLIIGGLVDFRLWLKASLNMEGFGIFFLNEEILLN